MTEVDEMLGFPVMMVDDVNFLWNEVLGRITSMLTYATVDHRWIGIFVGFSKRLNCACPRVC